MLEYARPAYRDYDFAISDLNNWFGETEISWVHYRILTPTRAMMGIQSGKSNQGV